MTVPDRAPVPAVWATASEAKTPTSVKRNAAFATENGERTDFLDIDTAPLALRPASPARNRSGEFISLAAGCQGSVTFLSTVFRNVPMFRSLEVSPLFC